MNSTVIRKAFSTWTARIYAGFLPFAVAAQFLGNRDPISVAVSVSVVAGIGALFVWQILDFAKEDLARQAEHARRDADHDELLAASTRLRDSA